MQTKSCADHEEGANARCQKGGRGDGSGRGSSTGRCEPAGDSLEGNAEAPPRPKGRGLTTRSANFSTRWQTAKLKRSPTYQVLSTKGSVYLLSRYQVI